MTRETVSEGDSLRFAVQANLRSKLSAQRGQSHNPRIIESRLQGYFL